MTDIIRKTSELSELKVEDMDKGIVSAYVNTMGVEDLDGDVIEPTAFNNSIENNLPISVLHSHDPSQVIGKVIAISKRANLSSAVLAFYSTIL